MTLAGNVPRSSHAVKTKPYFVGNLSASVIVRSALSCTGCLQEEAHRLLCLKELHYAQPARHRPFKQVWIVVIIKIDHSAIGQLAIGQYVTKPSLRTTIKTKARRVV